MGKQRNKKAGVRGSDDLVINFAHMRFENVLMSLRNDLN